MKSDNLSKIEKDVLREIANIGTGNAATSMSQLINQQVIMEVPSVQVVTINELMDIIGGPEKLLVTILFRIEGEVTGTVYFILTIEEAESLMRQMVNDDSITLQVDEEPDDLVISMLQEMANILTGSYLSALADFTGIKMTTTIPYISIDMAAATLVTGLVELSEVTDYAIIIDTKITGKDYGKGVKGHFLLIPDPTSIPKLFNTLGIDYEE